MAQAEPLLAPTDPNRLPESVAKRHKAAAAATAEPAHTDALESHKSRMLASMMWQLFLMLECYGCKWSEYVALPAELKEDFKTLRQSVWLEMPAGTLTGAMRAWR